VRRVTALDKKWRFADDGENCNVARLLIPKDRGVIDSMNAVLNWRDAKGLKLEIFHAQPQGKSSFKQPEYVSQRSGE